MSEKKENKLLRKRNVHEVAENIVDQTAPPAKRVRREKLTKADTTTISDAIANKTYKVINYKEDAHTSDYQFILCVIHSKNECDYAHDGFKDSKEKNAEKWFYISLSIGPAPYIFICKMCYEKTNLVKIWKFASSSANFRNHMKTNHNLIQEKIQWTVAQRMFCLKGTIEYIAWDRKSFNSVKGAGLKSLMTDVYNLGCKMKQPVKSIGILFCSVQSQTFLCARIIIANTKIY